MRYKIFSFIDDLFPSPPPVYYCWSCKTNLDELYQTATGVYLIQKEDRKTCVCGHCLPAFLTQGWETVTRLNSAPK